MYKLFCFLAMILFIAFNYSCDPDDITSALENSDLVVDTFYLTPADATVRDSITFHCIIKNEGLGSSDSTKLKLKVGGESMPPEYDIPPIGSNSTFEVSRTMLLPIALTYLAIATVDFEDVETETNEDNNVDSLIFSINPPPRANLIIDTIIHSPESPTTIDSITFTINIANLGEAASDSSKLSLKVGGESMPPKYDIPPMFPGDVYSVSRKMLLPISLTYLAIANVDCDGEEIESDETDNVDSLIFRINPRPKPNLKIDTIISMPDSPTTIDSITFRVRVTNDGEARSDSCQLSYKVGGESMPPKYNIPGIEPGATYTVQRKMLLPIALTYLAIATIDCDGELLETDETDNVDSLIFRVNPAPKPNLVVDNISLLPTVPTTEDSITFSVRVRNIGDETSDTSKLAFKVGGESMPPQFPIPSLPAGSNYIVTRKMLLPIALTYLSIATVDCNSNVAETDETDNIDSLIFSVVRPEQSDLEIIGFSNSPVSPTVSDSITFSVMVRNRGERASYETTLRLKVGGESTPPEFDVPALLSGETYTVSRKLLLPIALTYLAIANIDPGDIIDEENESNNIDSLIFSVAKATLPDYQIMSTSILPLIPTTEDSITISAIIKNNGPAIAPVGEGQIKIVGEQNPISYEIPKLTVGATHTIKRKVLLKEVREYEIIVNADPNLKIDEVDEQNNEAKMKFFVSDVRQPNLIIESFYIKPSTPSTEDSIALVTVIKNDGSKKTNPCKAAIYVDTEDKYGLIDVPALVSGATHTIKKMVKINVAGIHVASAIIDTANEILESNEDDNRSQIEFMVETDQPDLHIKSLSLDPATPTIGQEVTITAIVENIGTGDADSSITSIKIHGDISSLDEYKVPKLRKDSSYAIKKITTFNSERVYTIIVSADSDNDIMDEISEGNNTKSLEIDVTNSLLAFYKFTTQGDMIYDSSSNGYHGKNNNVISAVDPFGNNTTAGGFDSYSSYVEMEKQLTPLSGHSSWAVTFWQINYSTPPGPYMTVLNFGNDVNSKSVWIGFNAVSGSLRAGFWGAQKESDVVKSEPYGADYKFFGISYDHKTGKAFCMTSDGSSTVKDTLNLAEGISPNVDAKNFIIGKEIGVNGANYLSGGLDELRIYKNALSFEEMEKLMGN